MASTEFLQIIIAEPVRIAEFMKNDQPPKTDPG